MKLLPTYIEFARELRKCQTPAEKKMWHQLRGRKLAGLKFLRQHPILVSSINKQNCFYIADFYCAEKKLVLEIDGLIHVYQVEYDKARDIIIQEMGLQVIRVTNEAINEDVHEVLNCLKRILNTHNHTGS